MNSMTESYFLRAEVLLFITTLVYFLMNGAQIFETAVLVPKWMADPPETFKWLADKNGISLKTFWTAFHAVHEIIFILAIIFSWKLVPIRNGLLILFAVHFAVRAWTLFYFAPNVIEFQEIAEGANYAADLVKRANVWKTLNYIRVGIFIMVSFGLIPLCIKIWNMRPG